MFPYNSQGVKPSNISGPVPEGEYVLSIVSVEEAQSKRGYPMVKCVCRVEEGEHVGAQIYHYVTFLPSGAPGAGIAIHFLKCLGEPWEEMESLNVDPDHWIGKKLKAFVIQETYKKPDGSESKSNKISGVDTLIDF